MVKKLKQNPARFPGAEAIENKGWIKAHRWLLLRRLSQLSILALFLAGPLFGLWIVKGNIASSLTFDILPLSDPYILLQSLAAGFVPTATAFIGAAIVLAAYFFLGGRIYCSWVCPMNIVTDTAGWLRRKLGISGGLGLSLSKQTRYWLLASTLILAAITGTLVWEAVNPVTLLYRGILYGMGLGWLLILAVFLFDLLISKNGWCGHLCPMGAFYSLPALISPVRISAVKREQCNDCMDCFAVCPEKQVIYTPLRGADQGISPVISSPNCTNCGRCIDVCNESVFQFGLQQPFKSKSLSPKKEVTHEST